MKSPDGSVPPSLPDSFSIKKEIIRKNDLFFLKLDGHYFLIIINSYIST